MSERGTFVKMAAKSIEKGIQGELGGRGLGARPNLCACWLPAEDAEVWKLSSLITLSGEPEFPISDMLDAVSSLTKYSLVTEGALMITAYSA